jgi:translation initiation factor 6 (eIF-6)
VFENDLADAVPVVKASIGGTRILGRLCVGEHYLLFLNDRAILCPASELECSRLAVCVVIAVVSSGNKNGLLLPNTTTDQGKESHSERNRKHAIVFNFSSPLASSK